MQKNLIFIYLVFFMVFLCTILAIITFIFADGTSYLSNNPSACANCHVMQETFTSWQNGGHHHVAVCNDCHVPHNLIGKWYTKAENGFHHSLAFTLGAVPDVIRARTSSKEITVQNCIRCHGKFVDHAKVNNTSQNCLTCHKQVGHFHP